MLHSTPEIQDVLQQFVLVSLGIKNPEIQSLRVEAIPLIIFYSPNGKEIHRHEGFLSAEPLTELLRNILSQK